MMEKTVLTLGVIAITFLVIIIVGQYRIYPRLDELQTKIEFLEEQLSKQESP